jgi:hypothetical protein
LFDRVGDLTEPGRDQQVLCAERELANAPDGRSHHALVQRKDLSANLLEVPRNLPIDAVESLRRGQRQVAVADRVCHSELARRPTSASSALSERRTVSATNGIACAPFGMGRR